MIDEGTTKLDVEIDPEPDLTLLENICTEVKVFTRKPDELAIERLGITDNVQRKDLTTGEKLAWTIGYADMCNERGLQLEWRVILEVLGLNRSQAYGWVKVIDERRDEWVDKVIRKVIEEQVPMKRAIEIAAADATNRASIYKGWFEKRPAPDTTRVSLGVCSSLSALQKLVLENVSLDQKSRFEEIDWSKKKEAKRGFAEFLKYWEEIHG